MPLLLALTLAGRAAFDPAPYLADLRALEDSTAVQYANLEWQVARGVVDPVALHRRTDSLIRTARSAGDARDALVAFGAAFRDGHFRLRSGGRREGGGEPREAPPITKGAEAGCHALGYRDGRGSSVLSGHARYTTVGARNTEFPTGTIALDGQVLGVLRIAAFGEDRYASLCRLAWPAAATADSAGRCGETCQRRLWIATSDTILAALRDAIARLARAGATTLLVDIADNGGGTDWVTPAARQFTATPLHGHTAAVIRHPHHERPVARDLATLRALLPAATDSAWRRTIGEAIARAEAQLAEVRHPCDRRAIWREGAGAFDCSQLATRRYVTGYLDHLPTSAHRQPGAATLFGPARFRYEEGVWQGPLVVLVNRHTASASEEFAATLKDGGAARVIGAPTYGAGCGHTYGGLAFVLPASGLRVEMPDCARIRRNGANEVAGIEVDVAVDPKDATAIARVALAGPTR